jgi:hypothetical protein
MIEWNQEPRGEISLETEMTYLLKLKTGFRNRIGIIADSDTDSGSAITLKVEFSKFFLSSNLIFSILKKRNQKSRI